MEKIMTDIFCSFDLYFVSSGVGTPVKSGYGFRFFGTEKLNLGEVLKDIMKDIMKVNGVQESQIHILTFTRV